MTTGPNANVSQLKGGVGHIGRLSAIAFCNFLSLLSVLDSEKMVFTELFLYFLLFFFFFHVPCLSLPTTHIDWRISQHLPPAQLNKSFCMLLLPFRAHMHQ